MIDWHLSAAQASLNSVQSVGTDLHLPARYQGEKGVDAGPSGRRHFGHADEAACRGSRLTHRPGTSSSSRYRPMLRAWCLKWHLQDSDADDVVQDVLVKLVAAIRKFQYDPARSFRAWLKTVTQHALSDFVASRRKDPGRIATPIDTINESVEAKTDLEQRLEDAFDAEVLELEIHRVRKIVKSGTWDAFHLTAVEGSPWRRRRGKTPDARRGMSSSRRTGSEDAAGRSADLEEELEVKRPSVIYRARLGFLFSPGWGFCGRLIALPERRRVRASARRAQ